MKLIWTAINISEGRNDAFLNELIRSCDQFKGVELKFVDIGKDIHRSVFSLFADLTTLETFSLYFFEKCLTTIDMRLHKSSHPRIGAVDVFPIIPIGETTMQETINAAAKISQSVHQAFNLPIYSYEESQRKTYRKRLEQIRKGNYEQFSRKIIQNQWKPDFGNANWNPKYGCTIIGARNPLIAVNFSLQINLEQAKSIASQIRESNPESPFHKKGVKAIGWSIPEYKTCQVSVNISNLNCVCLKDVFDAITHLSKPKKITQTEIIGLIEEHQLLKNFPSTKQAIQYLNLNQFNQEKQLIID